MNSDLPVIHGKPTHSLETITEKLQEEKMTVDMDKIIIWLKYPKKVKLVKWN